MVDNNEIWDTVYQCMKSVRIQKTLLTIHWDCLKIKDDKKICMLMNLLYFIYMLIDLFFILLFIGCNICIFLFLYNMILNRCYLSYSKISYKCLTQVEIFLFSYCKFLINNILVKYEFIFLSTSSNFLTNPLSLHLIFTYFLFFMNSLS